MLRFVQFAFLLASLSIEIYFFHFFPFTPPTSTFYLLVSYFLANHSYFKWNILLNLSNNPLWSCSHRITEYFVICIIWTRVSFSCRFQLFAGLPYFSITIVAINSIIMRHTANWHRKPVSFFQRFTKQFILTSTSTLLILITDLRYHRSTEIWCILAA